MNVVPQEPIPQPGTMAFSPEAFREALDGPLAMLIMEEWPSITRAELDDTSGDVEATVSLIAAKTESSRTRIRRHLGAWMVLIEESGIATAPSVFEQYLRSKGRNFMDGAMEALPSPAQTMRENLLASLLVAAGVGLTIGFVVGLRNRLWRVPYLPPGACAPPPRYR